MVMMMMMRKQKQKLAGSHKTYDAHDLFYIFVRESHSPSQPLNARFNTHTERHIWPSFCQFSSHWYGKFSYLSSYRRFIFFWNVVHMSVIVLFVLFDCCCCFYYYYLFFKKTHTRTHEFISCIFFLCFSSSIAHELLIFINVYIATLNAT